MMGDKCKKQVKVDNWGMFFLQRLQQHFAKSEFCDFTLQFCNDQKIKAHRLVLDVCTEYFQMLEKQGLVDGNVITMPQDMQPDVVIPVINFMYTGRLEFHADIQDRLYSTAQKMKMTVLTKLLDAQSLNTQQQKQQQTKPPQVKSPYTRVTPTKKSLPSGTFTNLQGKRISPRLVDPNLPQMLPGRKLPIWTRRCIPAQSHSGTSYSDFDRPIRIISQTVDEAPRPTRFEWPDDSEDSQPSHLTTTFEDISYESKPLMQLKDTVRVATLKSKVEPPAKIQKRATFEDVLRTGAVTKRSAMSPLPADSPKKLRKLDLQDVKDYVQEAQVRKNMVTADSDEEDVDNDLAMVDNIDDDDEDEETSLQNTPPHKSILKSQTAHEEDLTGPSKKVRFSLETASVEEKENSTVKLDHRPLPTRAAANISAGSTPHVTNHAKIITEVLKKYPHLVKNNKNIRLKIMQRGGSPQVAVERDESGRPVKSKVSYVVLKSDVSGAKGKSALGIKHGGLVEQFSSLESQQKLSSGAENITGPWLCHTCGTNDEPINFETYYDYRHHLQDVHMEKIDARICEHCGHRASKRNLLLYHLFTKHGVPPPRNCQFPKCDQCDYVALSESLLIKHRNNHSNNRDFICKVCNASFKSNGALQGHMLTNLHSDPMKKLYECPYCQKPFVRNINLKAHIRVSHKDVVKHFDDDDLDLDEMGDEMMGEEGEGQVMEVPVIDMMNQNAAGMTILAEHPDRSSEAEGLSHVASGIAASLGLTDGQQTVILLDENQEFIIQTTEIVGNEYITEDNSLVQEVQEYIVPEMISDENAMAAGEQGMVEYSEVQPMIHGTEEVLMILTDHCYAEEVISKDDDHPQHGSHVIANGSMDIMNDHTSSDNQPEENRETVESVDNATPGPDVEFTAPANLKLVPVLPNETYCMSKPTSSDAKSSITKPTVEMSDLLGEWDEELSQEADIVEHSASDAMPTRDDIPQRIHSMPDTRSPALLCLAEEALTHDHGLHHGKQLQAIHENYKCKRELSTQDIKHPITELQTKSDTVLSTDIEQQQSLMVEAEEMAHDSASLMAETGENTGPALVMELDSTYSQPTEDPASFAEEMEQDQAPFPAVIDTAHSTEFNTETVETKVYSAGITENTSFPVQTDQTLHFTAENDQNTEFAAETDQLTTFNQPTEQTATFLPFTESKPSAAFLPFAEPDQNTSRTAESNQPSTDFVPESDDISVLPKEVEHSTPVDAGSSQLPTIVGEPKGDSQFLKEADQSLSITNEGTQQKPSTIVFNNETATGLLQEH